MGILVDEMRSMRAKKCIYRDRNESVEARVKDLLSRMSLEEKVGQMTQIERRVATANPTVISEFFIGSMLSACGSGPHPDASFPEWAEMVNGFQKSAVETRLGIPLLYGIDAIHGNGSIRGATVFPHNVGLGATRDVDLVERIGVATALEVQASGIHCTFAPCVAVCKDPRWGRCYESFSEDTEIVRKMTSYVTGLQGQPPIGHPKGYPFIAGRNNVMACAKHFVGDGGTEKGKNEGDTAMEYEELESVHMAPYFDCIEKGVSMVMASYSSWNGHKMHSHRYLLTDILKHKLQFQGIVISDWRGIDRLSEPRGSNYRECIGLTINSGIDMVIVPYRYEEFFEHTIDLVKAGEVSMARIDDAVERILRVKFIAGLFEQPYSDPSLLDLVGCKSHRDLAREAVRKSLVLLKNGKSQDSPFLPLKKKPKRILVTGSHAHDLGFQCGAWTRKWQGLSDYDDGVITTGTTILEGIREAVGSGSETEVIYERIPTEEILARRDICLCIAVVGEYPYAESFGDDPKLTLPEEGLAALCSAATSFPTAAVLISGRPLVLPPKVLSEVEAVVAAWWPGTEGGGVADVVLGECEFEGRLPVTWFDSVGQLNDKAKGCITGEPLFGLGFGLRKYGGGECDGGSEGLGESCRAADGLVLGWEEN